MLCHSVVKWQLALLVLQTLDFVWSSRFVLWTLSGGNAASHRFILLIPEQLCFHESVQELQASADNIYVSALTHSQPDVISPELQLPPVPADTSRSHLSASSAACGSPRGAGTANASPSSGWWSLRLQSCRTLASTVKRHSDEIRNKKHNFSLRITVSCVHL